MMRVSHVVILVSTCSKPGNNSHDRLLGKFFWCEARSKWLLFFFLVAILSHRSLCGGELGAQDADDAGSETEGPFLQLNSCTELERLKPSFRCRACREASRVSSTTTVETNSNPSVIGNSNGNSHTDKNSARRRSINNRNHPSAATSTNNSLSSRCNSDSGNDLKTAAATVSVFCRFWGFRKQV